MSVDQEPAEVSPQEQFDQQCPLLFTTDDFHAKVQADEENLVVIFVLAPTLCTFANALETTVIKSMSAPRHATQHAQFYRVHMERCQKELLGDSCLGGDGAVAGGGGISSSPTTVFFLKGRPVGTFIGSNKAKMEGFFRNELIKRNDEMRDHDEAKAEAARLAAEENEEHEEGEEVEEAEDDE